MHFQPVYLAWVMMRAFQGVTFGGMCSSFLSLVMLILISLQGVVSFLLCSIFSPPLQMISSWERTLLRPHKIPVFMKISPLDLISFDSSFFFFNLMYLFDRASMQRGRQSGSGEAVSREPHAALEPRTPRSRPEPKAET